MAYTFTLLGFQFTLESCSFFLWKSFIIFFVSYFHHYLYFPHFYKWMNEDSRIKSYIEVN